MALETVQALGLLLQHVKYGKNHHISRPKGWCIKWAHCPTDAVKQFQEQTEEQPDWSLNRAGTQIYKYTHPILYIYRHTLLWRSDSGTFRHMKHDFIIQWIFSQYYLFNTDIVFSSCGNNKLAENGSKTNGKPNQKEKKIFLRQ